MAAICETAHKYAGRNSQQTVLLVLTERELQLFLPGFNPEKHASAAVRFQWLDGGALDAARWLEALESYQPSVLMTGWYSPPVPESWARARDCPLRYVCHITGSVRGVVSRKLIENGLIVTNWGSLASHTIAEHAMLLVLGALRNVPLWGEMMSEPSYSVLELLPSLQTRSLRGKRVGLHGFGAIAREIVEIFKVHKVRLFAYSAPVPRKFIESLGVSYCATLEELFSQSDILIECESLTAASKGSVSEDVLKLLPEDAVFVNVGRAAVVNESALIRIAREKRLRVAVDVYGEEPANRELLELPNAFLSPHIAGPTSDVYSECGKRALENVARFLNGEEVNGAITPQVYDVST